MFSISNIFVFHVDLHPCPHLSAQRAEMLVRKTCIIYLVNFWPFFLNIYMQFSCMVQKKNVDLRCREWILCSRGNLHTPFQIFIQDILTHF
jgi:hypothetical protein